MNGWQTALVAVLAIGASVLGGWPITAAVLRLAQRSSDAGPATEPGTAGAGVTDGGDGPAGPRSRAVLRGGTWIGILERVGVTGAVLLGYPAAVAFVVAVKGLGRYPELREHPGASERFVIGTLTSLLWAAGVGVLGRALLG